MVWAPLQYRAPFCVGTMGAGHFGQFEFMEVTEGKPYNRASSVGRFIGRSFCVQAKDKLRPTWRPSAESPQQKCTPFGACGTTSPKGKHVTGFSGRCAPLQHGYHRLTGFSGRCRSPTNSVRWCNSSSFATPLKRGHYGCWAFRATGAYGSSGGDFSGAMHCGTYGKIAAVRFYSAP